MDIDTEKVNIEKDGADPDTIKTNEKKAAVVREVLPGNFGGDLLTQKVKIHKLAVCEVVVITGRIMDQFPMSRINLSMVLRDSIPMTPELLQLVENKITRQCTLQNVSSYKYNCSHTCVGLRGGVVIVNNYLVST